MKHLSLYCIILIFFLLTIQNAFAQNSYLKGKIIDAANAPLSFAHITALPTDSLSDIGMAIAMSDATGNFKLQLNSNVEYEVTGRFLGYLPLSFTIKLKDNQTLTRDIVLQVNSVAVKEVVVLEKPASIYVRPDTIIYDIDSFVNGDERKLRDVLEKLPGVEVDENNRVFVNGVQVKKLMIENKPFFGGNSSLAVKYIPADALDKIEILDNHSDVSFLEGDEMAMNIRLKEEKKQFAFGEVKAGSNGYSRYQLQPNIFYYAPKTNVNFIGNVSNAGKSPFTYRNYFEFNGGMSSLNKNSQNISNINDGLLRMFFLENDVKNSIDKFGALNVSHDFSEKLKISTYFIVSHKETIHEDLNSNQYILSEDFTFQENKTVNRQTNYLLGLGKLKVDFKPSKNQHITYQAFTNFNLLNSTNRTYSESIFQSFDIEKQETNDSYGISQALSWHQSFSKKHTGSWLVNYKKSQSKPTLNWLIDGLELPSFVPTQLDSVLNIFQDKIIIEEDFQAHYKHQWSINNNNSLHLNTGYQLANQQILTTEYQRLSNNEVINFNDNGFGSDFKFQFEDIYTEVSHKFKKRQFSSEVGLGLHQNKWQTNQENTVEKRQLLLLPHLQLMKTINNVGKFDFNYQLTNTFPNSNKLLERFTLSNYNIVYKGNADLSNEISHAFDLHYSRFSLRKRNTYFARISYLRKINTIQENLVFEGINQFVTPSFYEIPQSMWRGDAGMTKEFSKWRVSPKISLKYTDSWQFINEVFQDNHRTSFKFGSSLQSKFDQPFTIKLAYFQRYSLANNGNTKSLFVVYEPTLNIKYRFLKDFLFTLESKSNIIKRQNSAINHFNLTDLSLLYKTKKSPFGFELEISNLFNVQQRYSNSFSDFMVTESFTFIMPRVLLLNIIYEF